MRPVERRNAVELGARAFREFLRYHASRRLGGRPWRLVIAGDLFDFMSVVDAAAPASCRRAPPTSAASASIAASAPASSACARICENHQRAARRASARFAAAGHSIDIIVGNHDVELLAPEVVAELDAPARAPPAPSDAARSSRIRVVPWFVYVPGVAWIEHGHVYDEGCSFEFNLAPTDPKDGKLDLQRRLRRDPLPRARRSPRSIRTASRSGASGATCSTAGTVGVRLVRPAVGRRTRGSRRRCSRAHARTTRSSAAIAAAASTASASRRSPRPAASRSRPRPRSIASRARR